VTLSGVPGCLASRGFPNNRAGALMNGFCVRDAIARKVVGSKISWALNHITRPGPGQVLGNESMLLVPCKSFGNGIRADSNDMRSWHKIYYRTNWLVRSNSTNLHCVL
jgi:hypothetical protein